MNKRRTLKIVIVLFVAILLPPIWLMGDARHITITFTHAAGIKNLDDDKPLFMAEIMPSFPEGKNAMDKFISDNLKYPEEAQAKGIQGRVTVRFVVSKTGDIVTPEIIRGIDPDCDKEALRVISAMPKWLPGKHEGKNVNVYFTLPVIFKLNIEKENVILLDGEEISEEELKLEAEKKANDKNSAWEVKAKVLTDEEISGKYGDKYKGKVVTEIIFEEGITDRASFPGGDEAMNEFISKNIRYPMTAHKAGIQGRVAVRFLVRETGVLDSISIVRKSDPLLDKEALRLVKSMPKWIPGKKGGKAADTYFTIPIVFKLRQTRD